MGSLLRRFLRCVAGSHAPLFMSLGMSGTLTSTGVHACLAIAGCLLFVEAWAEGDGDLDRVKQELLPLLKKHGTLECAIRALARGDDRHTLISAKKAGAALHVLEASDSELEALAAANNAVVIRLRLVAKQYESSLPEILEAISFRLGGIESKISRLAVQSSENTTLLREVTGRQEDLIEEVRDARELVRQHNYSDAMALLHRLRQKRWESLDSESRYHVLANLGIIHHAREEYEQAAEAFIQGRRYSDSEKARCFEALGHYLRSDLSKAFELAERVLVDFPESILAAAVRIRSAPNVRALPELEAGVPAAIRRDAEIAAALADRAIATGDFVVAERFAKQALRDAPDSPEVLALLGNIMLQSIITDWRPGPSENVRLADRPRLADVIAHFSSAMELLEGRASPARVGSILINRAIAHRLLGDTGKFELDLANAYAICPKSPGIAMRYALYRDERGEPEEAIHVLRQVDRNSVAIDTVLAWFLERRGGTKERDEAIRLLEPWLERMEEADPTERYELIGMLVLLYAGAKKAVDGLFEAAEQSISLSAADLLRAKYKRSVGETAEAVRIALAINPKVDTNILDFELHLARELQDLECFREALTTYKNIESPGIQRRYARDLLYCAHRIGDEKTIIDFCKGLRAAGETTPGFVVLEADVLSKYGAYDLAIKILQEAIDAHEFVSQSGWLRLRLSLIAHQADRPELVETDLAKLPRPDEIHPSDLPGMIMILRQGSLPERAVAYAYTALRRNFGDAKAHAAMIASVLGPFGNDVRLPQPEAVATGTAVYFKETGSPETEWYIIEDEPEPQFARQELSPDSPVAVTLLDKKPGDSFVRNPEGFVERIARIVEVVPKQVARFRDCMHRWEERFPQYSFVQDIRLPKLPSGELDFAPWFRSLDKQEETVQLADSLYRDNLVPLSVYSRFGNTISTVFHVASTDGLHLRCSTGSRQESDDASNALETADQVVLDGTAAATLLWIDMPTVVEHVGTVVVSRATLKMLEDELIKLRTMAGSMGKQAGRYIFRSPDDDSWLELKKQATNRFEYIISFLKESAIVESGLALLELPMEARDELVRILGRAAAESLVLANKPFRVLWTDDLAHSMIARRDYGVRNVWTYVVLQRLTARGSLERQLFTKSVGRLHEGGYWFTPLSSHDVLEAAQRAEWDPLCQPVPSILRHFKEPGVEPQGLILIAGQALAALYRDRVIPEPADRMLYAILDHLRDHPQGQVMIRALGYHLPRFFGLDVISAQRARRAFSAWAATHPLV